MKKIEQLLDEIESHIPHQEKINSEVSSGSVGWHIEHMLLTMNMVIKGLKDSDPKQYKSRFDIKRIFVMAAGKIPRGRIKAPTVVQPTVQYNTESLREHLSATRANYQSLESLSKNNYFTHPFLGDFKVAPTKRFLQIHTNHHLSIINDIIKK